MKIIKVIQKPYIIQSGNGMGLYRTSYMYLNDDDKKEYYGGHAFYYEEDAKRFLKNNKKNDGKGWIE